MLKETSKKPRNAMHELGFYPESHNPTAKKASKLPGASVLLPEVAVKPSLSMSHRRKHRCPSARDTTRDSQEPCHKHPGLHPTCPPGYSARKGTVK